VATLVSLNKVATVSRSNPVMDNNLADNNSLVTGSSPSSKEATVNRSSLSSRADTVSPLNNNRPVVVAMDSRHNRSKVVMDSRAPRLVVSSLAMANNRVALSPVVTVNPPRLPVNLVMDSNRARSLVMDNSPAPLERNLVTANSLADSLVTANNREVSLVMANNRRLVVLAEPCSKASNKEWVECPAWVTAAHRQARSQPCAMHS
jgi:hypothetical protein